MSAIYNYHHSPLWIHDERINISYIIRFCCLSLCTVCLAISSTRNTLSMCRTLISLLRALNWIHSSSATLPLSSWNMSLAKRSTASATVTDSSFRFSCDHDWKVNMALLSLSLAYSCVRRVCRDKKGKNVAFPFTLIALLFKNSLVDWCSLK